jgi:hypothetical protein
MKIKIKNRKMVPEYISTQEIRAIIQATAVVCGYHNHPIPVCMDLTLTETMKELGKNKITGGGNWGCAWPRSSRMSVWGGIPTKHGFTTTLIHEVLHLCAWHEGGQERPTSTLTARLKPVVIQLAKTLARGTQQRAAWFAHTKISYRRKKSQDSYNGEQWKFTGTTDGWRVTA